SRSRNSDFVIGQGKTMLREHNFTGLFNGIEVMKRLSLSHEDHILNTIIIRPVCTKPSLSGHELSDNLMGFKLAFQSLKTCMTEGAVHSTPHLTGDAQTVFAVKRDNNRFNSELIF